QADGGAVAAGHLDREHGVAAWLWAVRLVGERAAAAVPRRPGAGGLVLCVDARSGWRAIALLMLCRVGQGLALGGSWDGLPSLLALNAPENRRGWYAMLGQLGAPLGFFMASALFAYLYSSLSIEDFLDWG